MTLDRKAAMTAVGKLGDEIGLSAIEAAYGIHKVVTESMAAAARIHLVEKGKDPRALCDGRVRRRRPRACGRRRAHPRHSRGHHSPRLGRGLVPRLPRRAAQLRACALAIRCASRRAYDAAAINGILSELEAEGRALLAEAGIAGAQVTVERSADMRLVGQMHEINVPLPAGTIGEASLDAIRDAPSRTSTPSATRRSTARPQSRRSASMCACSGRRPNSR